MTTVRKINTLLSFKEDNRALRKWEQDLDGALRKAQAIAAGIGAVLVGAFGIDKIIEAGDAYTTTMNRLGASTSSAVEATQAFEGLYTSARETGIAVDESSKAFMRFSPAMQKLGYNMSDTISLIDGLQKGLLAAGATAQESGSVFQQLGQAINANVFQGEELGSFLENASPTLVNTFAEALGTTSDKLKEMGSEGKLTAKNVLPAMLQAAKAGRDEFGRMRVTVGLAMARSGVAVDRFTAELERAFRFTEILARGIEAVGQKIDQWRSYIPSVRRVVDELGGLESILAALGYGIISVTALTLAFNGALSALIIRAAVLAAPFLAFAAAVAFVGATLHDFITWVKGGDTKTVFGDLFGPFDDLVAPLKPALDQINKILTGTPDEVIKAWNKLKEYFRAWAGEAFKNFPPAIQRLLGVPQPALVPQDLPQYREQAAGLRRERIDEPAGNWLLDRIRGFLGHIGYTQRVEGPDGTMHLVKPGERMSEALMRRAVPPPANVTATQNNSVTNNVTVNATGASGPEVAAGATSGMDRATDSLQMKLDALSRQFRMSLPGVEGGGGVQGAGQ